MNHWRRLDLRSKTAMPPAGATVALRMVPNNNRATFYTRERRDIGFFKQQEGGRKFWWHGCRGTEDPKQMRAHYDIWWCRVPDFDGF